MMNPSDLKDNVGTIVVVIMENRSFDHMLGYLRHPDFGNRAEIEGITDLGAIDYMNPNTQGVAISPFWMNDAPLLSDLPHGSDRVKQQLAFQTVLGTFGMSGFVRAYEEEFGSIVQRSPPMGLLQPRDLPATSVLADAYTVCDHWFAAVPTSTAPNRLMSMCGSTDINETGGMLPDQSTVYDWLSDHAVRWRVYTEGMLPFLALMPRMAPLVLTSHFRPISALQEDLDNEPDSEWPQVVFIEPEYNDSPIHIATPCDNHPPLAVRPGEAFLGRVYSAVRGSRRWANTVLVMTYDEHGGFFDHVPPLPVKFDNGNGITFSTTGPRIPAIVASPFAKRGVSKDPLDNTSILQLLAERFTEGQPFSASVESRRSQGIASVSSLLDAATANSLQGTVPAISLAAGGTRPNTDSPIRRSFLEAMQNLVSRHGSEALAKFPQLKNPGVPGKGE